MRKRRDQGDFKREAYLRIVNEKMIYLSSRGARGLGDRVDIYAWGNVVALVGSPEGEYHLSPKSERCKGQNLCTKEVAAYLLGKYKIGCGDSLAVWRPSNEEDSVVFVSKFVADQEAVCAFDERFTHVELTYHKRYGEWLFIEDNCISFTQGVRMNLAPRLSLYQSGDVLALLADKSGAYAIENRGERKGKAIYSNILAEYCKKRFGVQARGMRLHAQILENGVCFTVEESLLRGCWIPGNMHVLNLGKAQNCFVRRDGNNLYLSVRAAALLGSQVELLMAAGWLGLRETWKGGVGVKRTGYQNQVYAKWIAQYLEQYYPKSKKLYLQKHGNLLVLTYGPDDTPELPKPEKFKRLTAEIGDNWSKQAEQYTGTVSTRL